MNKFSLSYLLNAVLLLYLLPILNAEPINLSTVLDSNTDEKCHSLDTSNSNFENPPADLKLSLQAEKSALLEGEQGNFTFILQNNGEETASDIVVALTIGQEDDNFNMVEETLSTSSNTSYDSNAWQVPELEAGESDTLQFQAISNEAYLHLLFEVVFVGSDEESGELAIDRCITSDCYPPDNFKCYYTNCTLEADEVLYPAERFMLNFAEINCFPTGDIGCGAKYNLLLENTSGVASAPVNLFLRAELNENLFNQSGSTLVIPPIPANSTLEYTADFGDCIEDRPFVQVIGLDLGITESDAINLFTEGGQIASEESLDAFTDVEYCIYNNTTDIAIRIESDGIIKDDNTASYQVFVTNNGNEIAESLQITYGKTIVGNSENVIDYSATSDYEDSFLSEDEESRARFLDYDQYWNIQNLAIGQTAVLNATASVLPMVDNFTTNVLVNDNSFLDDPILDNNQSVISFEQANFIDLELSIDSDNSNLPQYESSTFTFKLENKGQIEATGVSVAIELGEQAVQVGGSEVETSVGNYVAGKWADVTVPVGGSATLTLELFNLSFQLQLFTQVTAAEQEDIDSTPDNGSCCVANEDDEAVFDANASLACDFFRSYASLATEDFPNISLEETSDTYRLQSINGDLQQTLTLDKEGNLLDRTSMTIAIEPDINVSVEEDNTQFQLLQIDNDGDTLLNEIILIDYSDAAAIVPSGGVRRVSDGLVFGGFIVRDGFIGFMVKTDLNGQNAQFLLIEGIDNTFGLSTILENSQGQLFSLWLTSGNFSLVGVNADFSSSWTRQFAADTPSTSINDFKLSQDGSIVYVVITDNLRGKVIAYDAVTGADHPASFNLIDIFPIEGIDSYRMRGILPLSNGNLLFSNHFFLGSDIDGFSYGIVDINGNLIWSQTIEGEPLNIVPIAATNDGGYLFVTQDQDGVFRTGELHVLKTDGLGELSSSCDDFVEGQSIDLELSISSNVENIPIYTSETFTLTLVNNGPDKATNVEVNLPIDKEQFVIVGTSMSIVSTGNFYEGIWSGIDLEAGEMATLEVEIFNLSEQLELFAQVTEADQKDIDSSPNNGVCCTAGEDDEAVFINVMQNLLIKLNPESFHSDLIGEDIFTRDNKLKTSTNNLLTLSIFPNPTRETLFLKGKEDEIINYQILDLFGSVVQQGSVLEQQINVQQLEAGIYFFNIEGEQISAIRFVKL